MTEANAPGGAADQAPSKEVPAAAPEEGRVQAKPWKDGVLLTVSASGHTIGVILARAAAHELAGCLWHWTMPTGVAAEPFEAPAASGAAVAAKAVEASRG